MAGPAETLVIHYGTWNTGATGFRLHEAHELSEDADQLTVAFSVVVVAATEANLLTYVTGMTDQLKLEHQRLRILVNGQTFADLTATLDDVSGAAPGPAQAITASWSRSGGGAFNSSLSRVYRVRIRVAKVAAQTGKTAKRSQAIELTTGANGLRGLSVRIAFTPGPTGQTAREMSEDATHGFDARVTAIKAALASGAAWDESPRSVKSDEDDREVVIDAFYRELPFPQSASGTNDASLTNVSYALRVVRKPGRGPAGIAVVTPLAELSVQFSARVVYSGSQVDPQGVIDSVVLPYVGSELIGRATVSGSPVLLGHTLRWSELPEPSVSGSVLYLAEEGSVLNASAEVRRQYRPGIDYAPVLDGSEFRVDEHIGPGLKTAQVVVGTEETDEASPALFALLRRLGGDLERQGYVALGEAEQVAEIVRSFSSPQASGSELTSWSRVVIRNYRYVEKRTGGGSSTSSGNNVGSTRTRS